jgi:hypothetical protein
VGGLLSQIQSGACGIVALVEVIGNKLIILISMLDPNIS